MKKITVSRFNVQGVEARIEFETPVQRMAVIVSAEIRTAWEYSGTCKIAFEYRNIRTVLEYENNEFTRRVYLVNPKNPNVWVYLGTTVETCTTATVREPLSSPNIQDFIATIENL